MNGWRQGLAAFLVWSLHFFVSYGLMLIFPQAQIVGWLTLALGLAGLASLAWIARTRPRNEIAISAAILAAIAISWQSLVGLF